MIDNVKMQEDRFFPERNMTSFVEYVLKGDNQLPIHKRRLTQLNSGNVKRH